MNAAEVCAKARDLLAEHGWSSRGPHGPNGEICLVVALADASGCRHETKFAYWQAKWAVSNLVDPTGATSIAAWNDDPHTTFEDVQMVLKEAEAALTGDAA